MIHCLCGLQMCVLLTENHADQSSLGAENIATYFFLLFRILLGENGNFCLHLFDSLASLFLSYACTCIIFRALK